MKMATAQDFVEEALASGDIKPGSSASSDHENAGDGENAKASVQEFIMDPNRLWLRFRGIGGSRQTRGKPGCERPCAGGWR
jgi:hypothetical protein